MWLEMATLMIKKVMPKATAMASNPCFYLQCLSLPTEHPGIWRGLGWSLDSTYLSHTALQAPTSIIKCPWKLTSHSTSLGHKAHFTSKCFPSKCIDPPHTKDHSFWTCNSEWLQIDHRNLEVCSVYQKQTVISDISLLPVIKLNLRAKAQRHVSLIERLEVINKQQSNKMLTTVLFNAKSDWMNGHTYLLILLGSSPPSKCERVVTFVGYVCINSCAHKKWRNLGLGGKNTVVFHHIPGCGYDSKECTKVQVFGQAWEQLPKHLVHSTHHLVSSDVGINDSHLFLGTEKHMTEQKLWEMTGCDLSWSSL